MVGPWLTSPWPLVSQSHVVVACFLALPACNPLLPYPISLALHFLVSPPSTLYPLHPFSPIPASPCHFFLWRRHHAVLLLLVGLFLFASWPSPPIHVVLSVFIPHQAPGNPVAPAQRTDSCLVHRLLLLLSFCSLCYAHSVGSLCYPPRVTTTPPRVAPFPFPVLCPWRDWSSAPLPYVRSWPPRSSPVPPVPVLRPTYCAPPPGAVSNPVARARRTFLSLMHKLLLLLSLCSRRCANPLGSACYPSLDATTPTDRAGRRTPPRVAPFPVPVLYPGRFWSSAPLPYVHSCPPPFRPVSLFPFLDPLSVVIPDRAASNRVARAQITVSCLLYRLLLPLPRSGLPCSFLVPMAPCCLVCCYPSRSPSTP